jgi:hypothetical protein
VVTDLAVMTDVYVSHQEVMIPNARTTATAFGPTMNVYVLSKNVVISNYEKRLFAFEFQILRRQSDGSKGVELIVVADRGGTLNHHMGFEAASVSDLHTTANTAIRPNAHVGTQFSFRADNCRRMNHGC